MTLNVGDRVEVEIGPVAHGGHCVARHEGRVLFVRGVLPGERALVEVVDVGRRGRFVRAVPIEVMTASEYRVTPPCPFAGPRADHCGGCDFQHVRLDEQRRLKAAVVREQLERLGGITDLHTVWSGEVEPLPDPEPSQPGLRWRRRVRLAVDATGQAGLHPHRSHDVVAIDDCLIAHAGLDVPEITGTSWPGVDEVTVQVDPVSGERIVTVGRGHGVEAMTMAAAGRTWQVTAGGFWQVHPDAADVLAEAVMAMAEPRPGEHLVDLYAGVGLFSGVWGSRTGGRVDAVEGHRTAASDAGQNLADLPQASVHGVAVERFVASAEVQPDVVVLDPPRVGAKRQVVEAVAGWLPRAVVYVACDPAALARDVSYFAASGYRLERLRAFDLFPMTHHVECVALLVPEGGVSP
ncbi:MAG TPA: TRAM domain-containing protein [Actinomycetes bacterium]|nr:TRAM domain-containing protein [Actinomycetes bacterium]